jgi:hypothetical protein
MRARTCQWIRSAALLALLLLGGTPRAGAQALVAVQPLDFGQLLPGTQEVVTVEDAWRRAEVKMTLSGNVDLRVVLPEALVSRDGARIPLTFRYGDGAVLYRNARISAFDPNQSVRIRIPPGHGKASLLLGATAGTAPGQPAGTYTATMVVVVSPTDT